MADNILSAKIQVTAPGVANTFAGVAAATNKTTLALQKLPQVANQSTLAMTNLGRVVQDAPFGFLGIANNLNPLLESFQRLRASTGSNAAAFKALGSSLLGAGGLGFALSAVSTLLILYGDKLFGASKASKDAKDAADKYKDAIKGIFAEVAKEATQVASFVAVLKSETETRDRRLAAIKELQKIQPEIFAGLKLEGDAVVGLDAAYINYVKSLSTVIAVKLKQQQLETLITKQLELQGATLTKTQTDFINKLKLANDLRNGELKFGELNQKQLFDKARAIEFDNKLTKQNAELNADIAQIIADISELSKGVKLPGIKDVKGAKELKFEYDALKAIFEDLLGLQAIFSSQIEAQVKLRAAIRLDFANGAGSAFDDFTKQIPAVSTELQKRIDGFTKNNPILLAADANLKLRLAKDEEVKKQLQELSDTVRNTAGDVFAGIGDTIGEALSGGDFRKGIQSFVTAIADGISSLGKQFIKIGLLAILAKNAFSKLFANPALSIVVGVALVAAGAALKNALSGGIDGARALGGPVKKGGTYLVGERGPELFTPDTGGKIVSNSALKTGGGISGGGMSVQVIGQLLLRGNDLVAALANANRSQGRLA